VYYADNVGNAVAQLGEASMRKIAGSISGGVIFPATLWPSASNRNFYLKYFLGVKTAGA